MTGHASADTHSYCAGMSDDQGTGQPFHGTHHAVAGALVQIAADVLDDIERTRVATANRLQSLTAPPKEGERGGWFGKGIHPAQPEVAQVRALLAGLEALEHQAVLDLRRALRQHPLHSWVKRTVGVGEKQAARLLAAIGDPAERRTVSQLWAYCGLHVLPGQRTPDTHGPSAGDPTDQDNDGPPGSIVGGESLGATPDHAHNGTHGSAVGVAPKRRRGERANWSGTAKMRARLVAESCIKQRHSPYRAVYDQRRAHTDITHPEWTLLHHHNDALRVTAKAIVRDLWVEARRLSGHTGLAAHSPHAGEAA